MRADDDQWQRLIQGLRSGDQAVMNDFFREFGASLERIAEKQLPAGLKRRVGAEDVVQSACRTFFRRAQGGEFQLEDSENLWRLMCAITLTKVREQMRFHLRKKRSLQNELPLTPVGETESVAAFEPVADEQSPAEALEFAEQFQQIMTGLDREEQQVIDLKLQDLSNDDVAEQLGCSERTVRRILKKVQAVLTRSFDAA